MTEPESIGEVMTPFVMVFSLGVDDYNKASELHEKVKMFLQREDVGAIAQGWVAIHDDAEMVLDVFKPAELGGGRHTLVVKKVWDEPEYVIEHSLVCRRTGEMASCPFIELMRDEWEEDTFDTGRYTLAINETQEEHGIDLSLSIVVTQ